MTKPQALEILYAHAERSLMLEFAHGERIAAALEIATAYAALGRDAAPAPLVSPAPVTQTVGDTHPLQG